MSALGFVATLLFILFAGGCSQLLTRDDCNATSECVSPRRCVLRYFATRLPKDRTCPGGPQYCGCYPPEWKICSSSNECSNGEVCARSIGFPFICTSPKYIEKYPESSRTIEDAATNPLIPTCPTPASTVKQSHNVDESCIPGSCKDGLSCIFTKGDFTEYRCCSALDEDCKCLAMDSRTTCIGSADCYKGEVCAASKVTPPRCFSKKWIEEQGEAARALRVLPSRSRKPTASKKPPSKAPSPSPTAPASSSVLPASPTMTPQPEETPEDSIAPSVPTESNVNPPLTSESPSDEICFDAEMLRDYPNGLVYERHRPANVLCDSMESCATKSHMVVFHGRPLMMGSYCEIVGCSKKVIHVNSPRWRRRLLIKTKTEGLLFTAFAARYETKFEEHVLRGLVRSGL